MFLNICVCRKLIYYILYWDKTASRWYGFTTFFANCFPQRFIKQHFVSVQELFNQTHVYCTFPHIRLVSRPVLLCTHFMTLFAFVEGSSWPDRFGRPLRHIPFHFCTALHTSHRSPASLSPLCLVWVRVCGPCQQFWPQYVLMTSEDVKYSWQGLVCAPQPHLERLFF